MPHLNLKPTNKPVRGYLQALKKAQPRQPQTFWQYVQVPAHQPGNHFANV